MKKILIDQCLQCWHLDDDTYRCRYMGEKIINPYQVPADCPLPDDLPESKKIKPLKWIEELESDLDIIQAKTPFCDYWINYESNIYYLGCSLVQNSDDEFESSEFNNLEKAKEAANEHWINLISSVLNFDPESKGSETDMGTKIEPEFPSWTETESGVTEKSNPQYGIYHFLKHWYYRVVAPCLKSDGWIPVSRIQERIKSCEAKISSIRNLKSDSIDYKKEGDYYQQIIDVLKTLLPAVPQERGETK